MACRHGDAGCPWGPVVLVWKGQRIPMRSTSWSSALRRALTITICPPNHPSPYHLLPPTASHTHQLSLAPLYICPPLVADCLSPGFSFHPDRDPLLIHFTRQRSGTARTVFICTASSGHRISRRSIAVLCHAGTRSTLARMPGLHEP
jgi:hypothetical protein